MSSRKKRKLDEMGLADYLKRVDREEEEGQFQTDIDLSAYSDKIINQLNAKMLP